MSINEEELRKDIKAIKKALIKLYEGISLLLNDKYSTAEDEGEESVLKKTSVERPKNKPDIKKSMGYIQ